VTHDDPGDTITHNIERWVEGDKSAEAELFRQTYHRLKQIARNQLRVQPPLTLTPTELVHETYTRLMRGMGHKPPENRRAFYRLAGHVMRRICIDYLRARSAQKRHGHKSDLAVEDIGARNDEFRLLTILEAVDQLKAEYPRPARAFELRFVLGLSKDEAADLIEISTATLSRDVRFARHWLVSRIQ